MLLCVPAVANAQTDKVEVSINGDSVQFTGSGLAPSTVVYATKMAVDPACRDTYEHLPIMPTTAQGTFQLADTLSCETGYTYLFSIGKKEYTVAVTQAVIDSTAEPTPCVSLVGLQLGGLAVATKNVGFWMLPSVGPESYGGEPLFVIKKDSQARIIDGPICNEEGVWWRFEYVLSETTHNVGWIREAVDDVVQLAAVEGGDIQLPNYPQLSTSEAQAFSLLEIPGIRIRNIPDVAGERVDVLKLSDGPVRIIGQNASGTFIQVQKGDKVGWVCTHLTGSNFQQFQSVIPVTDQSTNSCFSK